MIDYDAYEDMHPRRDGTDPPVLGKLPPNLEQTDLGPDFFMCLPPTVKGFNMEQKKWGMSPTPRV